MSARWGGAGCGTVRYGTMCMGAVLGLRLSNGMSRNAVCLRNSSMEGLGSGRECLRQIGVCPAAAKSRGGCGMRPKRVGRTRNVYAPRMRQCRNRGRWLACV